MTAALRSRAGAVAAGIGPWRLAILFGAGALAMRLVFWVAFAGGPLGTDSREYLSLAAGLAAGDGFPEDSWRAPAYPVFVVAVDVLLPGSRVDNVLLTQHVLGAVLVSAMCLFAWHIFGRAAAVVVGVLAAFSPALPGIENWVMADFLFGLLSFAALALVALAIRRGVSIRLLLAAGAVMALATYFKPSGQFVLAAAILGAAVTLRRPRPVLVASGVLLLTFAVGVVPLVARNHSKTGKLSVSTQGGITLFHRAFEHQNLTVPADGEAGRLLRRVQLDTERAGGCPAACRCPTACVEFRAGRFHQVAHRELRARGYTELRAVDAMGRLAGIAIRDRPVDYAAESARATATILFDAVRFVQPDIRNRPKSIAAEIEQAGVPGPLRVAAVGWFLLLQVAIVAVLVAGILGGILMLVRRDPRAPAFAVLACGVAVIGGMTALTHGGLWRYSVSLQPLLLTAAAGGAVALAEGLRLWWRTRRAEDVDRP